MGNCLKNSNSDDISLLRDGAENSNSRQEVSTEMSDPGPPMFSPVFYATSSIASPSVLNPTAEEEIKLAKRMGLLQHLPIGIYDGSKKSSECCICMIEFSVDEAVRYLPCMHIYHVGCIDDWLMRSFTCPSCMEPVDAALLNSYETT